jgi:hypothetical protein
MKETITVGANQRQPLSHRPASEWGVHRARPTRTRPIAAPTYEPAAPKRSRGRLPATVSPLDLESNGRDSPRLD